MPTPLTAIGFDADDTLWQHEQFYQFSQARFVELLSGHADRAALPARLLEAEKRNLDLYGFGVKGFTLSMIETALEVTQGAVPGAVVAEILATGRAMLAHPIEPLPHARETLEALAGRYRLILITKGDLFDQERKLAQSGLGGLFDAVEIVAAKTPAAYNRIFTRHADGPARALMIGNSLKSDVLPPIEAGAWGVHVPHPLTWSVEHAEEPTHHPRFRRIDDLGGLLAVLDEISAASG